MLVVSRFMPTYFAHGITEPGDAEGSISS
jgi:hypothetical protein